MTDTPRLEVHVATLDGRRLTAAAVKQFAYVLPGDITPVARFRNTWKTGIWGAGEAHAVKVLGTGSNGDPVWSFVLPTEPARQIYQARYPDNTSDDLHSAWSALPKVILGR